MAAEALIQLSPEEQHRNAVAGLIANIQAPKFDGDLAFEQLDGVIRTSVAQKGTPEDKALIVFSLADRAARRARTVGEKSVALSLTLQANDFGIESGAYPFIEKTEIITDTSHTVHSVHRRPDGRKALSDISILPDRGSGVLFEHPKPRMSTVPYTAGRLVAAMQK